MEESWEDFIRKKSCYIPKNCGQPDYLEYHYSGKDWCICAGAGTLAILLVAGLFYRSVVAALLLSPLYYLVYFVQRKSLIRKRIRMLNLQFRDAIQAVSAGLQAGYSIENAFLEAQKDMAAMHGTGGMITKELAVIAEGIRNNRTLEELLTQFAERSHIEDIRDFTEVFIIAKRSGGDLAEIIRACCDTISDKIEIRQEINTAISAKQFEGRIMDIVPFFIIFYINSTSPGFFNSLYHNVFGILIMTFCLFIYLISIFLSEKITAIEI